MKIEMNLSGLDGVLKTLKQLPPEIVSKRGGPVARSLRRGGRMIAQQAQANLSAAIAAPGRSGVTKSTGVTAAQVWVKRGRVPLNIRGERILVTVKSKPHPSGNIFRKRPIRTNDIAFILEHGTAAQPATPWLRPAFTARAEEAMRTVETSLVKDVTRIAAKLAAQNRSG